MVARFLLSTLIRMLGKSKVRVLVRVEAGDEVDLGPEVVAHR